MVERFAGRVCGRAVVCFLMVLALASPTQAVVYPDEVNNHIEAEINRFVDAPQFFQLDPAYFNSPEWNSLERFPFGDSPYFGNRDWGMSDAGKAVMALEAFEPALPHTRYRIRVTYVDGNAEYPDVLRLVEVVRFNVGPALAADIREVYGDQFTPDPQDVGTGGHSAWRFAMVSTQGLPNQIIAVSRRFLGGEEAEQSDCLGVSCLALVDPGDEGRDWTEIAVDEDGDITPYRMRDARGLSVPTRVADLLSGRRLHGDDLLMVISSDVIGQDVIANGVLLHRETQQWFRRTEIAGIAPFWSTSGYGGTSGETGMVDVVHAFEDGTDGPAWRYTLLFESAGQPARRYEVLTNGLHAVYNDGNADFVGLADAPGHAYARDPHDNVLIALWPANALPPGEQFFAIRVFDTGRREAMGARSAHELRLVASLPDRSGGLHRVWTGSIWTLPDLPSSPGFQTLPGAPFVGRAQGLSVTQHNVGDALAAHGLIVRAEFTLHAGVSRERLDVLLVDDTDNARLSLSSVQRQTFRLRIGNLEQDEDGALGAVFGAPQRRMPGPWPGIMSGTTVPLLDQ
jgi:hypothetical protein